MLHFIYMFSLNSSGALFHSAFAVSRDRTRSSLWNLQPRMIRIAPDPCRLRAVKYITIYTCRVFVELFFEWVILSEKAKKEDYDMEQWGIKCSGIPISRTLSFSNLPITRTKSRFPSSFEYCNVTPDFSNSPIFRTNFHFPWRFVKSGFLCGWKVTAQISINDTGQKTKENMKIASEKLRN